MLRRFRPPLWAALLALVGLCLFAVLGTWQLRRGMDKQAQLQALEQPGPGTMPLHAGLPPPEGMQRADAQGSYVADRQLLQDGPPREGRPGFQVWTPMRLADGALLLVNRGWIPQPGDLAHLEAPPAPPGVLDVHGWWRSLPAPGLRLGDDACAAAAQFPATVVYPRREQLQCLLGETVLPGVLLLDAIEPGGFIREWHSLGLPPERHYGYAVTWYALGLTAIFLLVKLNLKP